MPCMNHLNSRRRRQISTASPSAWFLSLLQLCSTTALLAQAQEDASSLPATPIKSTYLRKSRQLQQSASDNDASSYLTFVPTDDATIYSSSTEYDTLNQLIFTGQSSSSQLNALLKFDLSFINHKSSTDLSRAELSLCNSLHSGGAFDPLVVNIYGVSATYFYGGGDWSESRVTWGHSPQVDESTGKAEFVKSHMDDDCIWHTFSIVDLVRSTLDSPSMNELTLRIVGEDDYASISMYASKEFKEGKVAPKLDVYFRQGDEGEDDTQQQSTAEVTRPTSETTDVTSSINTVCSFDDKMVSEWSSSDVYNAADLVSNHNKVYQCKPYPFSGWCNDYEPGVQSALPGSGGVSIPWRDAWVEKGDCIEMQIETQMHLTGSKFTSSHVYDSELCATPMYQEGVSYAVKDLVLNQDAIYECNVPSWCSNRIYEPGQKPYWKMAWTLVHESLGCPEDVPDDTTSVEDEAPHTESTNTTVVEGSTELENSTSTTSPSSSPTASKSLLGVQCAPPFTVGHSYKFMESMSFNHYNYACYVPDKCSEIKYAPRLGDVNVGVAWWKTEECVGSQTRHPTVLPTPAPTFPKREESAHSIAHDEFYTDAIPMNVAQILIKSKADVEESVLVRRTPDLEWEPSSIYDFDGLMKALGVMTLHRVRSGNFHLGEGMDDVQAKYGLVNLAAFLAHSMAESIKYDICDEPNWEQVMGRYPLSNACGQGGLSYQDMTCPEDESHMECPVKTTMITRAVTHANWGAEPGAPTQFFCQPKAEDGAHTGFWDPNYKCDRPFREPPEYCDAYEGQTAGRIDTSVPAANMAARTDVEGCCWWGRGVIQTRGVCGIGRLNYFLGKGAADKGRPSPYPNIDFCEDPEVICGSSQHSELKWIAGMSEWVDRVQSYDKDGYSYLEGLKRFVDGGLADFNFLTNASKILQHGCHGDDTRCHKVDGAWERMDNFKMILKVFRLEFKEEVVAASSSASTSSFSKPTPPKNPAPMHSKPSPRPRPISTAKVPQPPSPPLAVGERRPWYVNYDLHTCVNDGKQAAWVDQSRLYGSKEVCCSKHFDYSEYKTDYLTCISGGSSGASNSDVKQDQDVQESQGGGLAVICPPSGWWSSPDCKSYFNCENGNQSGVVNTCGDGLIFDQTTTSCRPDYTVKCGSATQKLPSKPRPPSPTNSPAPPRPRPTPPPIDFANYDYHSKTRPNTRPST